MGEVPKPPKPRAAQLAGVRRYTAVGTALIALAFAGPALATLWGVGDGFSMGRSLLTALGSLLVLALVAWALVRARSDLAKAKARAVVGLLLCLTVGSEIATAAKEAPLDKRSVADAVTFQVRQAAKFEDLGKRFGQVTVTQYVTAAGLASPQDLSAGQVALDRYRELLAERRRLLQSYLSEYATFVNTLPPGEARRGAESAIGLSRQATEDLYSSLDRTQSAHADAIEAIFSWAQANAGELGLSGELLLFRTQKQQMEFAALALRLRRTELAVTGAVEKAQIDGIPAALKLEQSMRQADRSCLGLSDTCPRAQ